MASVMNVQGCQVVPDFCGVQVVDLQDSTQLCAAYPPNNVQAVDPASNAAPDANNNN
jgi:hypothetical protein